MAAEYPTNLSRLCCSFCGKSQREVRKLIAGPMVYICNECIGLCNDIIAEEVDREEDKSSAKHASAEDRAAPGPEAPLSTKVEFWLLAKVTATGTTEDVELLKSLDEVRDRLAKP